MTTTPTPPPRTSRGTVWRGEQLTCLDCGATHPDRDDVADDGKGFV